MRRLLLSLGIALAALGCSSPEAPPVVFPSELVGRWQSSESLQPSGSFQRTLTFQPDGRVVLDFRSYGAYGGQHADDLSGYARSSGTFYVDGSALTIQIDEITSWDAFYGLNSPEQTVKVKAPAYPFSPAQYSVDGDRLTLQYFTAPADLPVLTTAVFGRVP
jgi:hypothetical protein